MEHKPAGENIQEVSPFLPLETASQITKGQREQRFWKYWLANNPTTESKMTGLQDALAALDKHEADVRKFISDAEEQALADWVSQAETYRDEVLMPLRHRQSDEGVCFVNFYRSEWEEYSPAEGGCYWMRRTPLACFPLSYFDGTGYWGHPSEGSDAKTTLERAKEYGRDKLGLTFDGDTINWGEGDTRKVRGLTSCSPEADAEVMLEAFPFQSAAMCRPHYE